MVWIGWEYLAHPSTLCTWICLDARNAQSSMGMVSEHDSTAWILVLLWREFLVEPS